MTSISSSTVDVKVCKNKVFYSMMLQGDNLHKIGKEETECRVYTLYSVSE